MKKKLHFALFILGVLLAFPTIAQPTAALHKNPLTALHYYAALNNIQKNNPDSQSRAVPFAEPEYDSIYRWAWDLVTTDWALEKKTIDFMYDAQSNLTGNRIQSYIGSTWENATLYSATYDANNYPLTLTYKSWDGTSWGNDELTTYTYDVNGNLTSETNQSGDGGTNWENVTRYVYTYDGNQNMTNELHQAWDGNAWENAVQYTITYDTNNDGVEEIDQTWSGTAWENKNRYVMAYNAAHRITDETDQTWNGSAWENSNRYTLTYDTHNYLLTELDETWTAGAWVNTDYYVITYDINDKRTSITSQIWEDPAWLNAEKTIYTYTADLLTMNIAYVWDSVSGTWQETDKVSYQYNANEQVTLKTTETKDGANWIYVSETGSKYDINNLLFSRTNKYWYSDGSEVESGDSTYYFIHDKTSGINGWTAQKNIQVYPNPSTGTINIELDKHRPAPHVEVYNALGEKIMEQQSSTLIIPNATKGLYYLKVHDGKKQYNEKIIIQ